MDKYESTNFMMMKKTLVLALVATFIAGMSAIMIQDNMALAAKPAPYVVINSVTITPNTLNGGSVFCNAGDKATGGGFEVQDHLVVVEESEPLGNNPATGWGATAYNQDVTNESLKVFVDCSP